jgi:hypothetical protein
LENLLVVLIWLKELQDTDSRDEMVNPGFGVTMVKSTTKNVGEFDHQICKQLHKKQHWLLKGGTQGNSSDGAWSV